MSDDADPDLKYYEIQRRGALEGLNPMAGEWRGRFDFAPTSYSAPPIKRQDFKEHLQAVLNNKFLFSHLVQVTLTLLLDEQTVLETDAYGDLDNYAKLLNDALKGKDGLIIDDCQIHRLDIAWQEAKQPAFEVEIKAMLHDDFVLKDGLKLFAMRDGLYYPQAAAVWREAEVVALTPLDAFAGLLIWETMTGNKRSLRHAIRQHGGTRLEAFTFALPVMPTQLGFHRSRALASGLPIVEHATWRAEAAAFNAADPEHRLDRIERALADHAATIRGLPDHT